MFVDFAEIVFFEFLKVSGPNLNETSLLEPFWRLSRKHEKTRISKGVKAKRGYVIQKGRGVT